MSRRATAALAALTMSFAIAAPAAAAEPANQACLGKDFSSYAREGTSGGFVSFAAGSGFGLFNASLAQRAGGLHDPIQLHLAGAVPDFIVPNSCND